jgi:hypothetical protein
MNTSFVCPIFTCSLVFDGIWRRHAVNDFPAVKTARHSVEKSLDPSDTVSNFLEHATKTSRVATLVMHNKPAITTTKKTEKSIP